MPQSKIAAVLVSHHPDHRLDAALDAALPQVGRLFVVDNASAPAVRQRLEERAAGSAGKLRLMLNAANLGLAAAQNQGIAAALAEGADWVLLLDQDSIPDPGMVEAMLAAWEARADKARIGLLAPRLHAENGTLKARVYVSRHGLDFHREPLGPGDVVPDVAFAMASGSLIAAEVFREIGAMREDFFVDYIDFEFAFRMRRAGWRLLGVGDAGLGHRLGEAESRRILGRELRFNSHSAFRRYHIYRNRLRVWRAYGLSIPAFLAFEAASMSIDLAKLLLLEHDKSAKLKAIARGIADALTGTGGRAAV